MPTHRPDRPARAVVLAAGLAALLALPTAAAVRLGTPNAEAIVGTSGADQITGDGGNDRLKGLAGNDTYFFADNWGADVLEERPFLKVAGKTVPGGTDTLSFNGVREGGVTVATIREWRKVQATANRASGPNGEVLRLDASAIEDLVGTQGSDQLTGGSGPNRLTTGGGANDTLQDGGGFDDGPKKLPNLPPSNDAYLGAAANTGAVVVNDFGGAADLIDLRPLSLSEVYLARFNCDGDPALECLQIVTGVGDGQVQVAGQFGALGTTDAEFGKNGRIETIRFADTAITFGGNGKAGGGLDGEALLGRAETARQKELAERAPALAAKAARQATVGLLPALAERPERR